VKELDTILTKINLSIPLTKHVFQAHVEGFGAWQDLVGGKNCIRMIPPKTSVFFSPRASYPPACTQASRRRLPRSNPPWSRLPHRAFPRRHRQRFPFASTDSSNSSPGPIVTSGSHGCHIGSTPPSSQCRPPSRGGHRALHGRSADCGIDA